MTSRKPLPDITNFYLEENIASYTSTSSSRWGINKSEMDDSLDTTPFAIRESTTTVASVTPSHIDTTTNHDIVTLSNIIKAKDHDSNNFNDQPTDTPYLSSTLTKVSSVRQ